MNGTGVANWLLSFTMATDSHRIVDIAKTAIVIGRPKQNRNKQIQIRAQQPTIYGLFGIWFFAGADWRKTPSTHRLPDPTMTKT